MRLGHKYRATAIDSFDRRLAASSSTTGEMTTHWSGHMPQRGAYLECIEYAVVDKVLDCNL
jgi:hypothetical protein